MLAIVIRGITDPQIRASATNAKLMPNELVEFLSIYVKPNTSNSNRNLNISQIDRSFKNNRISDRKRRFEVGRCFVCGERGHKQSNCYKKRKIAVSSDVGTSSNLKTQSVHNLTKPEPCSFCKKPGHKIETCFAKLKSESRNTSNVNLCQENYSSKRDIVVAVIQGIPVDVLIDSGSSISLISSSMLKYFKSACKPSFRVLRGIGGREIESTYFVTLPIEFSEITLEVDLHVVHPEYMNTPIIIGTDVLNREGVTYVRTRGHQYLAYESNSKHNVLVASQSPIRTDLTGEYLQKLLDVVHEFSSYFIEGTATSTVNTGTMSIKLNSTTPIYYRPYRLSYSEILKVREIVRELLGKSIIRESMSEYASPILLVKKKDGSDRILDMATGFHQILMDEDSIPLTGFVTPEGHYEYLKMPYGLANAPVVYQRIISKTLRQHLDGRGLHHPPQRRESNVSTPRAPAPVTEPATPPRATMADPAISLQGRAERPPSVITSSPGRSAGVVVDHSSAADRIIDAIRSINMPAQATGKLDSCMRGPYRVVKALPHGRYELQLLAGSYGKSTQAAAEFMVPWRGEWTPETCAAFFEDADGGDDDVESMSERAGRGNDMPLLDPVPSTSRAREDLQPARRENEDVLQSGEAVLAEDSIIIQCGSGISFGSRALADLPSLKELSIDRCKIKPVPSDLLQGDTKLQVLAITNTDLEELPKQFFKELVNLETLNLNENNITALDPLDFRPLTALKRLYLNGNRLEKLPP
ncbi:hypothetical protein evm_014030 [Chilo suppressalis]|nr:hypothetical protein evm_014030 [Chilo suppressalis]